MKKLAQPKTYYQKKKAKGLCAQAHCRAKAAPNRSKCKKHLRRMAAYASKTRTDRINERLCTYCGTRPQFWGLKCIICRQQFAEDPLPSGAKRAIREYRKQEARRQLEQTKNETRLAARELIETGMLKGKRVEALRLYLGMDDGKTRTYEEVSELLNVSGERVRQLLLPSKSALNLMLEGKVPWRARKGKLNGYFEDQSSSLAEAPASRCSHEGKLIRKPGPVAYKVGGLSDVSLVGLSSFRCRDCNYEEVLIPAPAELHQTIAKAILNKPASLSGLEFQFLRITAGLTVERLALKLGLVPRTVALWERASALRLINDLGARIVLRYVLFGASFPLDLARLHAAILSAGASGFQTQVRWDAVEHRWHYSSVDDANDQVIEALDPDLTPVVQAKNGRKRPTALVQKSPDQGVHARV